ncbi:MAG: alpha/beta hydrolase [Intrasporangiaceae bacterium]|nr:alpha/beta hydrolase [Intrasporangiaceae bacterium]
MSLTVRGMPLRTAVVTTLIDRLGRKPVGECTREEIEAARERIYPRRGPVARIFGPVREDVQISSLAAAARDGHEIPLRAYRPAVIGGAPLPVIVFFHGGGWVWGNVVNDDPLCTTLAAEIGALVLSVDYRMAPHFPAPVAAHDCIDATAWVSDRAAEIGADGTRVAVCGESAGGNLAAVVAQAFRDEGRTNLRHQTLIYPATDLTLASPSLDEHANAPILTRDSVHAFADHYCPDHERRADPIVSPLFGSLDGLPPALIQTADLDPIRDDGTRYARALEDAGVRVRLTNYVGAPHGFASLPGATLIGSQHRAEIVTEVRRYLLG